MSDPPAYRLFVGIDVAATTFTAAWVAAEVVSKAVTLPQTPHE